FMHLWDCLKLKKECLLSLWNISKNTLVEQIFLRIGFFLYVKAVASLGTASYAAHMVCMNIMHISFAFGDGLQIANTSLVGQSMGKKREDMAMIYTKVTKMIGVILAIFFSISIICLSDVLAGFFTSDAEVVAACEIPMAILAITVLFQIPQVIIVGALRGAGDVKFIAGLMLISVTLIRPALTYLFCFPFGLGLQGAWIALFTDQVTRNAVSNYRFRQGKWKHIIV
ncbi:MAG: MATE family efflux transporter, partial [Erysipelotrichia bacterium]|nr:MATE family efflux transporter [Erysipelotrichia bacterium]